MIWIEVLHNSTAFFDVCPLEVERVSVKSLIEGGHTEVVVRATPIPQGWIIIRATRTREVLGEESQISEITFVVNIPAARRRRRNPFDTNFCLAVRRACYDVVKFNFLETWLERLRGDDQCKNGTSAPKL